MNCKKCGNQLMENEQYCRVCGEPVVPQTNQFANQTYPVNNMNQNMNFQPEMNQQPVQSMNNMESTPVVPQPEVSSVGQMPNMVGPENNMMNQQMFVNPQPEIIQQPVQTEVNPVAPQPKFNPLGDAPNSTTPSSNNNNSKKSKNLLLIIIVAVVLIGIGIALVFILKPNDKSSGSKESKTNNVIDDTDDTKTTDGEYDIPSYFKLKFTVPDNFNLSQEKKNSTTNNIYYIFKNNGQSGYLYSVGLMRLNTIQSSYTVANSIREGVIEQLKEETNNVSDFQYVKGNMNIKTINGKSWKEYIDTATSNSMNLEVTTFMYIIDYDNATYIAYGLIAGDINSAEPTLSTFLNSLKF